MPIMLLLDFIANNYLTFGHVAARKIVELVPKIEFIGIVSVDVVLSEQFSCLQCTAKQLD